VSKTSASGDLERFAFYDIKQILREVHGNKNKHLNIGSLYQRDHLYSDVSSPPIFATRYISGYGVSQGGIVSRLSNKLKTSVLVIYLEVIPWYLRIYMHTLRVQSDGVRVEPRSIHYKPAKDRSQPHHIELVLSLPPESVTEITFDFDRSYLKWTEYPPDANHGVYVNSALITALLTDSHNMTIIPSETQSDPRLVRIHTESLLVSLPTPDFSMPYNVICLVSTVVSLAFGPIHNLTTRRARIAQEPDATPSNPGGLWSRVKSFFRRKRGQEEEEGTSATNQRAAAAPPASEPSQALVNPTQEESK
jgi:phosphatidylinositol glycan class T